MQQLGVWPGVLLHGAIWGFWQAPLIVLSGYNYPGHNLVGVPWFIISCALLGVLFGWLQLASGSVFAPTIAHTTFNASGPAPVLLLRDVDAAIGGVLWSPTIGGLVMLLVISALAATGRLDRSFLAGRAVVKAHASISSGTGRVGGGKARSKSASS
jgi:membrane protease YdiL (CAAX protease family)